MPKLWKMGLEKQIINHPNHNSSNHNNNLNSSIFHTHNIQTSTNLFHTKVPIVMLLLYHHLCTNTNNHSNIHLYRIWSLQHTREFHPTPTQLQLINHPSNIPREVVGGIQLQLLQTIYNTPILHHHLHQDIHTHIMPCNTHLKCTLLLQLLQAIHTCRQRQHVRIIQRLDHHLPQRRIPINNLRHNMFMLGM